MKLNLGCGRKRLEGYVNVDIMKSPQADKVMDLSKRWGFKDSSADEIFMDNVIEHLDFYHTIREARRVLKKGGLLKLIVPHYKSPSAYMPQHRGYYSYKFFRDGFGEDFAGLEGLRVEKLELIPPYKSLGFLANKFPVFWEWFLPLSAVEAEIRRE